MTAAITAIAPIEQGIVLIVDDTPDNLAVLSDALDLAGYMVLVAMDGTSALERMHRRRPDVVLLDAMMPGIDGFGVARQLLAMGYTMPLLAVTARSDADAEAQARAAGFDDFLRKPVSGAQLAEALDAAMRR